MSERESHRHMDERWLVAAIVLPILYILSPGPLLWLLYDSILDKPQWLIGGIETFLSPLEYLYNNVDFVQKAYDAYFNLLGFDP